MDVSWNLINVVKWDVYFVYDIFGRCCYLLLCCFFKILFCIFVVMSVYWLVFDCWWDFNYNECIFCCWVCVLCIIFVNSFFICVVRWIMCVGLYFLNIVVVDVGLYKFVFYVWKWYCFVSYFFCFLLCWLFVYVFEWWDVCFLCCMLCILDEVNIYFLFFGCLFVMILWMVFLMRLFLLVMSIIFFVIVIDFDVCVWVWWCVLMFVFSCLGCWCVWCVIDCDLVLLCVFVL